MTWPARVSSVVPNVMDYGQEREKEDAHIAAELCSTVWLHTSVGNTGLFCYVNRSHFLCQTVWLHTSVRDPWFFHRERACDLTKNQ